MSFLFPLYALGALAIGLPLVFHLIQRRPQGMMPFSSLMFLKPSPPRLTRRSRLDNLLLLLLRALAVILLAAAFARPLLRSVAQLDVDAPARRTMLLVDTSASMQREGLWQQALDEVDAVLRDLQPADQIALATFDTELNQLVAFDTSDGVPARRRGTLIKSALEDVSPSWNSTNLGNALSNAADMLHTAEEKPDDQGTMPARVVLISDLQQGCSLDELNGYEWPKDVQLVTKRISASKTTNARALVLENTESLKSDQLRVRVLNAADSNDEKFRLAWADADGQMVNDQEHRLRVPPGESRVIRVSSPPAGAKQLMLVGDDHLFDNSAFVAHSAPREKTLLFIGETSHDESPRQSLLYYLQRASLDTTSTTVIVRQQRATEPLLLEQLAETPLIVVATPVSTEHAATLRSHVESGGRVLFVIADNEELDLTAACLSQLTKIPNIQLNDATVDDYAMFSQIAFQHPLFQPFNDPRFNNFTKIRFWSHRDISFDEESDLKRLADFDNGSPALLEQQLGEGRLWILAAGWQPDESQLALSTKFVPLLATMFDPASGRPRATSSCFVGAPFELPAASSRSVVTPDGSVKSIGEDETHYLPTAPGVYQVMQNQNEFPLAVNVASQESRTEPLELDQLEQHGVALGQALTIEEIKSQIRQMRDTELEGRQNLWRWLLVGVLGVLAIETSLAGWLSRRSASQLQTA